MLTIVLALLSAAILGTLGHVYLGNPIWTTLTAVAGFLGCSIPINLWVRKRQEKVFGNIQQNIEESQNALRRKMQRMGNKATGSTKGLQRQLEKQQAAAIKEALKDLDNAQSLNKWNFMAEKQLNTVRGQLHFQIKEFEEADKYFANSLNLDPVTVAMKMVRAYKNDDMNQVEKLYKKARRRFKGEKGTIAHALYSWILVKEDRIEDAITVLNDAKEKTSDSVLAENWEHLVNGRVRRFSNAGLGDLWYTLHLETPKPVRVKQRRGKMR